MTVSSTTTSDSLLINYLSQIVTRTAMNCLDDSMRLRKDFLLVEYDKVSFECNVICLNDSSLARVVRVFTEEECGPHQPAILPAMSMQTSHVSRPVVAGPPRCGIHLNPHNAVISTPRTIAMSSMS